MTALHDEALSSADVHVGRLAIYDPARHVVAYELLFRDCSPASAAARDGAVRPEVISSTLAEVATESITGGMPLFVNLTRPFLVGERPLPGRPRRLVVEVSGGMHLDTPLLQGLRALRRQGFSIAVADFLGERQREPLLPLADFVKIDAQVAGGDLARLVGLVTARSPFAKIVLENVLDDADVELYAEQGIELFQGPALHAAPCQVATLTPSQVVCVRLLAVLSSADPSADDVERVVSADPGLTIRVLRAATSAATGVPSTVRSLRQALLLLGPRSLSSWILLTLLGGLSAVRSDRLALVLARANACATLSSGNEEQADVAYTVGLLSGVCDVLGVDPEEVATRTGVADETRAALVENTGPSGRVLSAVLAHEAQWPDGVREHGLEVFDVSRAYLGALADAMRTIDELLG